MVVADRANLRMNLGGSCCLFLMFALVALVFGPDAYGDLPRIEPTDQRFVSGEQWALDNQGQVGVEDADIDAPEAWWRSRGEDTVVVAVIDTGILATHPELQTKLWENPGEIPGNGFDDDGNGYEDDIHGWNFLGSGSNDLTDEEGHGTAMASVIAASTGVDGGGMAGVCWNCKVMVLKVAQDRNPDYSSTLDAISYAVTMGADVINMSFSFDGPGPCSTTPSASCLRDRISEAVAAGIPVVSSMGNQDGVTPRYPAAYIPHKLVVAVGASNASKERWNPLIGGSNFGLHIDLVAPGQDILTADIDGSGLFRESSGTSHAAAHVSGILGLIRSEDGALRPEDLEMVLEDSATGGIDANLVLQPVAGDSYYVGSGLANAFGSLSAVNFSDLKPSHWASRYVRYALQECILDQDGFGDGTFRPAQFVTRAETLKLAYDSASLDESQSCSAPPFFLDVDSSDWFECYAKDAWLRGIVEGVPCTCSTGGCVPDSESTSRCFFGNSPVVRGEAAKMVSLSFGFDSTLSDDFVNVCSDHLKSFPDVPETHFAREHVHWMANARLREGPHPNRIPSGSAILSGYSAGGTFNNNFEPDQTINRAEILKVVSAAKLYFDSESHLGDCIDPSLIAPVLKGAVAPFGLSSIGTLFEQPVPSSSNPSAPDPFACPGDGFTTVSGSVPLNGPERDADQDTLFYFWSADGGSFTTSDPLHHSAVTWHPPPVSEDTVFVIDVINGDRKGLVGRARCRVLVAAGGSGTNTPATGSISSPSGTQSGSVTVQATAIDADGLERVSVRFVSGGPELVLCGPGESETCSGTSDSFIVPGIDPADFGALPGSVTVRLFVEDSLGEVREVAQRTFTYEPPVVGPTFTLTVTKQGDGDGTVSGGGIDCGPGCSNASASVAEGASVTLTGSGSEWIGFAGDRCFGADPCTFTMISDLQVRASFVQPATFQAVASIPGDGQQNVSIDDNVRVTFNRQVVLGPNADAIVFETASGTPEAYFTAVQSSERRLIVSPVGALDEGTVYNVSIPPAAVEDLAGNLLPVSYDFSFETATLGAPRLSISAYPSKVLEGREVTVHLWFDRTQPFDRTIALTSDPAGFLLHPSQVVIPAGELVAQLQVDSEADHADFADHAVALSASEAVSGTAVKTIEVMNRSNQPGSTFRFLAGLMTDDDNNNGIFEADEDARFRFDVRNFSGSGIANARIVMSVVNTTTFDLRILDDCELGFIQGSTNEFCEVDLRADDEIPTGEYLLRLDGQSSGGGFLEFFTVNIVNNSLPNFDLLRIGGSTLTRDPSEEVVREYLARNLGDGFDPELPYVRVRTEIDGEELLLGETYVDVRGEISDEETVTFTFLAPNTPGTYTVEAEINPAQSIAETTFSDNVSLFTLVVEGPNEPPTFDVLPGAFTIAVGETLGFSATATDPDDDPITYSLGPGAPAGASFNSAGWFSWTPQCGQDGSFSVELIAADDSQAADSVTVQIDVGSRAELAAQLTASTDAALPGTDVDWTLTVSNNGPSCTQGASVTSALPADLIDVTWTCVASGGSSCTANGSGSLQEAADLLAGGAAIYSISSRIADGANGIVVLAAAVAASGGAVDPNPNNNSSTATVTLRDLDFGDAPNPSLSGQWAFATQLLDDGARHGIDPTLFLGAIIDAELDGQPTLAADGDDLATADDDDGVELLGELTPCQDSQVDVTASAPAMLNAWVDFNTDGDWADDGEQIFTDRSLIGGLETLSFTVPCDATPSGLAFARFRLNSIGGLEPHGLALDGEVEDHGFPVAQVFRDLEVALSGGGAGTVVASPNGIDCGTDCHESYPIGSVVVLSASPALGSGFAGWSGGGCSGTGTCVLVMDQARSVSAAFEPLAYALTVAKGGNGAGAVASSPAGIDCGSDCSHDYLHGTDVTLTATVAAGSDFSGWAGGGCSGTGSCLVTMDSARLVTADFALLEHALDVTLAGGGEGSVSSSPSGIDCAADCSEDYVHGTNVSLTAIPEIGSEFVGWSGGGCSGTGTCLITMQQATSVTASFEVLRHVLNVTKPGNGTCTVTSTPAGIVCGADCSEEFDHATAVALAVTVDSSSEFDGWTGGGCTGPGACHLTMDTARAVAASCRLKTYPLTVTKDGAGGGTVVSDPAGIDCGGTCSAAFDHGTNVTLTATAASGSAFSGWSGAGCVGTDPCSVQVVDATGVTATFEPDELALDLDFIGSGGGTVAIDASGSQCSDDCTESFSPGTTVTLTASAGTGSTFAGWGGDCSGTEPCVVAMDQARALTVDFDLNSYLLEVTLAGSGKGTVTSDPEGIDCGKDCGEPFLHGSIVVLEAKPGSSSAFAGWTGGGCAATSPCQVAIEQATSIAARFEPTCFDSIEHGGTDWLIAAGPNDGGASSSWRIATDSSHSGQHSWFVEDEELVKDQLLVTAFLIPASPQTNLLFWHRYDTELGADGGVLEYSIDGGTSWFDILSGDGAQIPDNADRILANGYSATLGDCCSNPLADREAWSGSADWQETTVDLGDFASRSLLLRWRFGADDAIAGGQGWWIDDVALLDASTCPLGSVFLDGFESGDTSAWAP